MARKISLTEHECLHRNPREDYWIPPGTPPGTPTGKVPSKLKCYPTREIPDEYFRQFWEIPDGYLRTSPRTPPGTPPGTIPGSRPTKINIYPTMEIPPENYWTPPGTPPKTPPGSIPIKRGHHPTWEVPLRRKLRKKGKKDPYFYVDTEKEELCSFSSGETTTENSFSVLADQTTATEKEESQERSGSRKDCLVNTTEERRPFILTCIFDKFKNYMYNAFDCNPVKTGINKCIMYAYNNKNEVYSGYFPEPIYLESDDFNKTNELNAYKYPSFYFGKPIRQITNTFSRFNDKYFSKMRHAYKISQYIYNRKSTSSSKGTIDTSIGIKRKWHIVDNKRNNFHSVTPHISATTSKGLVEYTANTPRYMVGNPNGEYTPCNSQRSGPTDRRGYSLDNQRSNQLRNSRLKYYNQNNSSKNVDSYISKCGNNNKKVVA